MAALSVMGQRTTGESVRSQNVMAAASIANILKSSLGPAGLDKMLVDDIGEVTVSNDGATILGLLSVQHPAAKLLCELAELQDKEVGDGTTSVVILAAELLKNADELVKQKIHPTSIIAGYRLACREALRFMQESLTVSSDSLGQDGVMAVARTAIASKLISSESDHFAELVVGAVRAVKVQDIKGPRYPIGAVNVLKSHGGGLADSFLVGGYALNCLRSSQAMPMRVAPAQIACLDFSLQKTKMKLGVQVIISDPEKISQIRERESEITKERVGRILATGANVVLTTGGIDDLCSKYLAEAGAMGIRRVLKRDLRRIAKVTGASVCSTLANMEGDESFDATLLGQAEEVVQERVCDDELIIIRGPGVRPAASLVLRGPNNAACDEAGRAVHDGLCAVRRLLESPTVVPGGGAVEAALSVFLENFATTMGSREQLAVAEFSHSLLALPRALAANAALDAPQLLARLRACHHQAQSQPQFAHLKWVGLDLKEGRLGDRLTAGVVEPGLVKSKALKLATEAALTLLRIDDLIRLGGGSGGPGGERGPHAH